MVFVYLISNLGCTRTECAEYGHGLPDCGKEGKKRLSTGKAIENANHIGVNWNPEDRTRAHNRLGTAHCDDKSTNRYKPQWVLEVKLGPVNRKTAAAAASAWRKHYRTLYNRIRGGVDIAEKFGISSVGLRNFDAWMQNANREEEVSDEGEKGDTEGEE